MTWYLEGVAVSLEVTRFHPRHLQFYDVWVAKQAKVLDLSTDLSHYIQRLDLLPVEYLHGDFVPCGLMDAHLHLAERPNPLKVKLSKLDDFQDGHRPRVSRRM